jgi:cell division protease FtsH
MVTMYGMSDKFGVMGLATIRNQYLDGTYGMDCAQETAAAVDEEVRGIMNNAYQEAIHILEENRDMLDAVAAYLLKKETISGAEMMAILEGRDPELVEDNLQERKEQARITNTGVEPAARVVHMIHEPPQPEQLPESEEPASSAEDSTSEGNTAEDSTSEDSTDNA